MCKWPWLWASFYLFIYFFLFVCSKVGMGVWGGKGHEENAFHGAGCKWQANH